MADEYGFGEPVNRDLSIGGIPGNPLVSIDMVDGTIKYGEDYDPDEAARVFWTAFGEIPRQLSKALERITGLEITIAQRLCTCGAGISGHPHNPRCTAMEIIGKQPAFDDEVALFRTEWEQVSEVARLLQVERDRLRMALSLGWNIAQYDWAVEQLRKGEDHLTKNGISIEGL